MSDEIIQTKDLPEDKKEQTTTVDLEQINVSSEIPNSVPVSAEETKSIEATETKPQETISSAEVNPTENKTEPIINVVVPEPEKTNVPPEIIDPIPTSTEVVKTAESPEVKPQETTSSVVEVKPIENKTEPTAKVVVLDSIDIKNEPVAQTETSINSKSETTIQPEKPVIVENNPIIQKEIPKVANIPTSKDILLVESFKANMLRAKELLVKARFAIQIKKKKKMEKIMTFFIKNKNITNDDVREILSVSRSVALDYLNALKKENKIKQNGKGRGIFYTKV